MNKKMLIPCYLNPYPSRLALKTVKKYSLIGKPTTNLGLTLNLHYKYKISKRREKMNNGTKSMEVKGHSSKTGRL